VLGAIAHRETVCHARPRDLQVSLAGKRTGQHRIYASREVRLAGGDGTPGGVPTNRPWTGASVEIFRASAEAAERLEAPHATFAAGEHGRWGTAKVDPSWHLEKVLTSGGSLPRILSLAVFRAIES